LRLVLLREIPEDATLCLQWNDLVQRMERPQVFYTYEWSLAVQRAYHAILRPLLFLAYDGRDVLCGVASLAIELNGSGASFLCATTGDYCDFVSGPECRPSFIASVLKELRTQGIGEVTLTNLPADSDTVVAMQSVSKEFGYRCFMRTAYVCAQVALGKLERRPMDSKPVLPGRKMVRRSLSAMGREAPVRLDHSRTWAAVSPILSEFMEAHVARFLATGRISNMTRPERRQFLEELAKLIAPQGWLVLTRMMSGEKTLAWNYGFEFEGSWFWYQPTFETDLEKLSPGFCLLTKLIEEAAENPALTTVDLGLGAEEYKERFANQTRETLYVTLRTSATQHVREILRYRAAQIVRTAPRLEAFVRVALVHLRSDGVAGTLRVLAERVGEFLWWQREILFFEWSGAVVPELDAARVEVLNLNQLASAAQRNFGEESSLHYLVRSALRLREKKAEGFGFVGAEGTLWGCVWSNSLEGFFLPELNAKVEAPSPDCVVLFDRWNPPNAPDDRCPVLTMRLIAGRIREQGKSAWTYSSANDVSLIQGLESTGFQPRHSVVCRRLLGWQTVTTKTSKSNSALASEVSARV